LESLLDRTAADNPPRITQKARTSMEGKLSEERTWNAAQFAEALAEGFGVEVRPEAVR
jgi:hypothetical protein